MSEGLKGYVYLFSVPGVVSYERHWSPANVCIF